jgi:hypothetical protein
MIVKKSASSDGRMLDVFFLQGTLLKIVVVAAIIFSALMPRILDLISAEVAVSILSATGWLRIRELSRQIIYVMIITFIHCCFTEWSNAPPFAVSDVDGRELVHESNPTYL